MYTFIILGVSNTIFTFYQPYFRATDLPLSTYGIIFAVFSIFTAISALHVQEVEKKLGVYRSLLIMPIFLALSLLGASLFVWWGFIFFFFREAVRGFVFPILHDYTNKLTLSTDRATVLSIGGMFGRLGLAVISTSFGFLSDTLGLQIMFFSLGIIVLAITIPFLLLKPAAHASNTSQKLY